jgi:AcrR family transcriptional regulator
VRGRGREQGAFYGYFASKQELLIALLDDQARRLDEVAAAAGERGLEGLRAFTRETLREAQDPARVQLRADVFAAVAGDPELRARLASSVAHRRTLLRQAVEQMAQREQIAEPTRANAVASILLALADGLLLHRALDEKAFRWENVSAVVERLLDGLVEHDSSVSERRQSSRRRCARPGRDRSRRCHRRSLTVSASSVSRSPRLSIRSSRAPSWRREALVRFA